MCQVKNRLPRKHSHWLEKLNSRLFGEGVASYFLKIPHKKEFFCSNTERVKDWETLVTSWSYNSDLSIIRGPPAKTYQRFIAYFNFGKAVVKMLITIRCTPKHSHRDPFGRDGFGLGPRELQSSFFKMTSISYQSYFYFHIWPISGLNVTHLWFDHSFLRVFSVWTRGNEPVKT